jgi:N-acetylglucosaminyl-diphospho-decaprenol L-rhamnosyltransferase
MDTPGLDLGIVIVSYNVRDLLRDCLTSVFESRGDIRFQVCVVDNASLDGSADMVRTEFPAARLIESENLGYAAGNNRGLRAFGLGQDAPSALPRYLLLLNPDTVLPPSALIDMLEFLDQHPQAGVAGPRLVRQDGSLDKACRRSFPTPEIAFYRLSGLARLFPRSRRFGRYNMTFLSPDITTEVDAVVGAFMLIRSEALQEVGLLDERYFMYAEDLDLCYRIKQRGWQVWYNAAVTVLHYKGQSSRQRSTVTNIEFYRAMRRFHTQHFEHHTFFLMNWLIYAGIGLLGGWALLRNWLRPPDQRGVASAMPVLTPEGKR